MGTYFEYETRIGAADTGLFYQCRPSGVLNLLQEAATEAAVPFRGTGPEVMEKYHALWMVLRMWYHLDRPLLWDDKVKVKTWHRADRGVMLYRDFDLWANGERCGEAVSIWVLIDAETRKPLRLSAVPEIAGSGGEELCKDKKLTRVHLSEDMSKTGQRTFGYSDIDSNGHVNNVRYVDAVTDALHLERRLPGHYVSSLQVGYLKECRAGEALDLLTGQAGEEYYVHGVDAAGASRFDAALTLSPWVSA